MGLDEAMMAVMSCNPDTRRPLTLDQSGSGLRWVDMDSTPPTPEQVHAARLTVCEKAKGVEDARDLLDALGLLEVTA